jgi:hypothetical protein
MTIGGGFEAFCPPCDLALKVQSSKLWTPKLGFGLQNFSKKSWFCLKVQSFGLQKFAKFLLVLFENPKLKLWTPEIWTPKICQISIGFV